MAISPDGKEVVVGHTGFISLYNLTTLSEVKTISLSLTRVVTTPFDLVFAADNWIYFTRTSGIGGFHAVNLESELEKRLAHVSHSTEIKLHPNGIHIYGVIGSSNPNLHKYAVSDGNYEFLYDSVYHGNWDFGGYIWISDDGEKVLAQAANVFTSTSDRNTDLRHIDRLANGELAHSYILALDYSSSANRIYGVYSNRSNFNILNWIQIFEAESLDFLSKTRLPDFFIPDGQGGGSLIESEGHYVFINAAGDKCYVLLKISSSSDIDEQWSLYEMDID